MVSTEETYVTPAEVALAWPAFAKYPADEQAALIASASDLIRQVCRRRLTAQSYVETHSGKNRPRIWLDVRPVIAIAEVSINGQALDNTAGDAWTFKPGSGELIRGDGRSDPRFAPWFPAGTGNVRVVYSAGYDPIPAGVKRATILTIQAIRDAEDASAVFKSESLGDYSRTLRDEYQIPPPHARVFLDPYIADELY